MAGDVEGSLAQACADLARTMARPDAAVEVLPAIARHVADILGVRATGILFERPLGRIHVAAVANDDTIALLALEQDLGEGPTTEAFRRGTVTPVQALVDVGRVWPRWARTARAFDVGAWLAVPSCTAAPKTVVSASSARPRRWEDGEVSAVQVLADLASGWLGHADELDRVRRTADQLQEALDHRLVIEQAKGILTGERGCTLDQAFGMLRDHARRNRATVRSVAHAVVHLGLRPPLNPVPHPPPDSPRDRPLRIPPPRTLAPPGEEGDAEGSTQPDHRHGGVREW